MNGPIGKQMVDTLVESSANFEASHKLQYNWAFTLHFNKNDLAQECIMLHS